jgi:hypothetical protein
MMVTTTNDLFVLQSSGQNYDIYALIGQTNYQVILSISWPGETTTIAMASYKNSLIVFPPTMNGIDFPICSTYNISSKKVLIFAKDFIFVNFFGVLKLIYSQVKIFQLFINFIFFRLYYIMVVGWNPILQFLIFQNFMQNMH